MTGPRDLSGVDERENRSQRHNEQGQPDRNLTVSMHNNPNPRVPSTKDNPASDCNRDGCSRGNGDRWRSMQAALD